MRRFNILRGGINENDFVELLKNLEQTVTPSLSDIGINIDKYAKKLYDFAEIFLAKDEERNIAMVAMYVNDDVNYLAYLTFIAIEPTYQRNGLGQAMLFSCEEYARSKKMKEIRLEVFKENTKAIGFYNKMGYTQFDENELAFCLKKVLE